jgi:hypothetical protein
MFGVTFSSSTSSSNWPPELGHRPSLRPTPVSSSNANPKLQHYRHRPRKSIQPWPSPCSPARQHCHNGRCWEGRADHFTVKATDSILAWNGCWTSTGSQAVARRDRTTRNRRGPTWRPSQAKTGRYKAGWLKSHGAKRESERPTVPRKACKTTRWREGALL